MGDRDVRIERNERVATVLLDRPEKMNALNSKLREDLLQVLGELADDDGVRVVVFGGRGDAFAAGADVGEFAGRSVSEQREVKHRPSIYEAVADLPVPTIAAIHGYCLGGGAELALACDVRVADRSARIGQPEIRLGLIPGGGGTQRLPRLVGQGQAMRICLTGDFIEAEEAYRMGLVEVLTEPGAHLETAHELAARMARRSRTALSLVKRAVRASMEMPLSAGLAFERDRFIDAFASEDGRAGVRAFVERRDREARDRDAKKG